MCGFPIWIDPEIKAGHRVELERCLSKISHRQVLSFENAAVAIFEHEPSMKKWPASIRAGVASVCLGSFKQPTIRPTGPLERGVFYCSPGHLDLVLRTIINISVRPVKAQKVTKPPPKAT